VPANRQQQRPCLNCIRPIAFAGEALNGIHAIPVGAGAPANTGAAGAILRVACFAGMPAPTGPHLLKECAVPVGAGAPANTGAAGAIHRVACFAGKPAPTESPSAEGMCCTCGSGRAREHRVAGAIHRVACFAGMPAPTGPPPAEGMCCTCGSGRAREHRRSRCHPPRRLLRGHARSHRVPRQLKECAVPVGAGAPANTGAAGAILRVACFAGMPAPTGTRQLKECAVPVGAGSPANTGAAGAILRVACFAGMPAPTGIPSAEGMCCTCGSGRAREHRRSRCQPPRRLLRG